ncbi:phosphatidate cytidylyltransferase [Azoarcus olearius]|uniref:Phosphatidate cytidylyltransferase n=1 Tax=Azoarcus sp. (strain BH72) TaxID=418699 RepID=A1K6R6_AZOSB|nr:phosphatidate cytidylyltransferase [Azoarcus olearius]CAL94521.1 putative phosphatidate cytidylyltransferase [Azoarcus olearius]
MLKTRVITALVLLCGLLGALFLLPAALWLGFAAVVCAAAAWEWGALAGFSPTLRTAFTAFAGLVSALIGLAAGFGHDTPQAAALLPLYVCSALFWLVAIPPWLARKWRISGAGAGIAIGLVVLVPATLALAHLRHLGPWVLLAAMSVAWVADIAAYFAGRAFGRHKLAPQISPGKTWEGAVGATLGVVVFGLILVASTGALPLTAAVLATLVPMLVALTAVSIVGDLFESLLKRQAGLKDSGALLPGHGGVLDRIDSLTSTLPLLGLAALWLAR